MRGQPGFFDIDDRLTEPIKASEAAAKLREFVREIQRLDGQVEEINTAKKELYDGARMLGFNVKALKTAARTSSYAEADHDARVLKQYLTALCGPEAASLLKDEDDFGSLLFGSDDDSWPSTYSDPRYPLNNTPA